MAATPRNDARHVVIVERGDRPVLAKVGNQPFEIAPRLGRPDIVLADLIKIAASGFIDCHRLDASGGVLVGRPRFLPLGALYGFGFAPVRLARRAVKATTSELEVEV